jgi:uncharacterized NAD-dependent epimerase/dehydratase family protein
LTRRYVAYAPGRFATDAKTAHGVIAYGDEAVVAVVDPACAGHSVRDVLVHLRSDAPIVASLRDALQYAPTALLIGTAPRGGALPPAWRADVLDAIAAGLDIVSGLHDFIGDDVEFRAAAQAAGTAIWDVRKPPATPIFSGRAYAVGAPILLTVGNDCAVGKMTASLEFVRAAKRAGKPDACFVPTGQTGIAIAGWGIAIDRVVADFAAGAAETLVLQAAERGGDPIVVEGQGAINHPAYGPVTLALMYGSTPDALIAVCDPRRARIEEYDVATLGYAELIDAHESLLAPVKRAGVVGIALNTRGLSPAEAREEIARARSETGLPCDDLVRFGADDFYRAVAPRVRKNRPAAAAR